MLQLKLWNMLLHAMMVMLSVLATMVVATIMSETDLHARAAILGLAD